MTPPGLGCVKGNSSLTQRRKDGSIFFVCSKDCLKSLMAELQPSDGPHRLSVGGGQLVPVDRT